MPKIHGPGVSNFKLEPLSHTKSPGVVKGDFTEVLPKNTFKGNRTSFDGRGSNGCLPKTTFTLEEFFFGFINVSGFIKFRVFKFTGKSEDIHAGTVTKQAKKAKKYLDSLKELFTLQNIVDLTETKYSL